MRGNSGVTHSQEALDNDFSHFKAIETLRPHLRENSPRRVPDIDCSERTKEHHLYLGRHEKEVPACRMDLAIQGKAVKSPDDAPIPRVRLTLETEELRNPRAICDQNRSHLHSRRHKSSQRNSRSSKRSSYEQHQR